MRQVPALLCIVKGMIQAATAVASTLAVLLIIVYAFAIMLKLWGTPHAYGQQFFPTVPEAMFTLLFAGAFLDNVTLVMNSVRAESETSAIVFAIFILMAALTMMNLLVGVLCEVMSTVAEVEKEEVMTDFLTTNIRTVLEKIDTNDDLIISRDEFKRVVTHPDAVKKLEEIGVDPLYLVDYASTIFQSDEYGQEFDKTLEFGEFMDILLQLRGGNQVTMKDIVELRRFISEENTNRNLHLALIEELLMKVMKLTEESLSGVLVQPIRT